MIRYFAYINTLKVTLYKSVEISREGLESDARQIVI